MKGVKVIKDDTARIMRAFRTMTNKEVLVGVPMEENARDDGAFGNAQIGYINENGSEAAHIPPAPHLVPGVEEVKIRCADLIAKGAAAELDGQTGAVEKAYTQAGIVAVSSVKRKITSQAGFEGLSEYTMFKRAEAGFKGTKRLIWTGQYLNSITFVIRDSK